MKKSLFKSALMFCLMLPCTFALSACGEGDGKVDTKKEWDAALNLKSLEKFSLTQSAKATVYEIKYDGTNLSFATMDEGSEKPTSQALSIKSEDKYDIYNFNNTKGRWEKSEKTVAEFNDSMNTISSMYLRDYSQIFKFEDFTYNETNNYFYAQEVSVSTNSTLGEFQDSYYNVEIKFAGNNVSSIVYYDYAQQKTSYTFSYTDFVVEAPYIPVGPVTNVSAWNTALDLARYDNVTMIQNRQDGSLYGKLLWDGVNLCYMTYTHTQAGDFTIGILVVKEGDEYYRYQDNNTGQWKNKTLIDEDTYNSFVFSYLGLAEQYYFDDFEYNPTSEMYEADCITQHGQGETATIYNVKVEIKNNKVNKLTYTYLQETVTATYTYDDVTIELPGSN